MAVVSNAESYQYLQAYVLPILGKCARRINNIKLDIVGWLYILRAMFVDFVMGTWGPPARHQGAAGVPAIVLHACARVVAPSGATALWESNFPAVARGQAYWYTGVTYTEEEARAAALM